jgi:hypothetical protein
MARLKSKESKAGMSHTSWFRLPITKVNGCKKADSRREGEWRSFHIVKLDFNFVATRALKPYHCVCCYPLQEMDPQ